MLYKFKNIKKWVTLIFAVVFSSSIASGFDSHKERELATMIGDKYFIYPSNLIDYSVSGSSLIEFHLNSRGEVEDLHFIKSLGIPFDKSIIDGLGLFVSNEIISIDDSIKNQYRLEIKFEN